MVGHGDKSTAEDSGSVDRLPEFDFENGTSKTLTPGSSIDSDRILDRETFILVMDDPKGHLPSMVNTLIRSKGLC